MFIYMGVFFFGYDNYGIVGGILGMLLGLTAAGMVIAVWEVLDPLKKEDAVVVKGPDGDGDGILDEEAALSPRGELPRARTDESENSQ
jgi:NADPH:quinone reductase-like Zn-dependent oxidoreductase